MIKLKLPLKDIHVNQLFGNEFMWYSKKKNKLIAFYHSLGLRGHNGIDFKIKRGCNVYASHNGFVMKAGEDGQGGIGVTVFNEKNQFKTIYYHLLEVAPKIQPGINVSAGELLGKCDNTGKYTTGDHLHFGLKKTDESGRTINTGNGYWGAINPAPYFKKNWDKSNAYHRYGRKQNWWAEYRMRFKNPWLHRKLNKLNMIRKIYNTEFINAFVYGGWDYESVINPAMYYIWGWLKKSEYEKGVISFKR